MVESVVVASHTGNPCETPKTNPPVPIFNFPSVLAPDAYSMSPVAYNVWFVPPYISEIAEPFHVPCVMVPSFEIPDTARLVVVALLDVELMIERLVSVLLAELTNPAFNVCTAVHVFAFPKLSDATTLPVVGEMVSVLSELVTELTLPLVMQVLFIATHPPVRLMPFANVDDAEALVTFKRFAAIPPVNVDVAVVVAIIYPSVGDEVELRLVPSK